MTTQTIHFDWDDFHAHVQRLRVTHNARPPREAVAASLEAFSRWGVTPPASFMNQHPEAVAARSRDNTCAAGGEL
jgi:hypothetical protein